MKNKLLVILVLLFASSTKAQFINTNNPVNAALNTASAVLQSARKDNVPKDSVSGSCEVNGGTCNGAKIELFLNDKRVHSSNLTSGAEFRITRLNPKESYKFVLTWKRHQLVETRQVFAGEYISIKVTNN
jgi:hypothetical protein